MATDPTPAPAPEWARNMARSYYRMDPLDSDEAFAAGDLALLLASVRDAALREAASVSNILAAEFELNRDAYSDAKAKGADECTDAILALVVTAPKEATMRDFSRVVPVPRRIGAGPGPRNTPWRRSMAWALRSAMKAG